MFLRVVVDMDWERITHMADGPYGGVAIVGKWEMKWFYLERRVAGSAIISLSDCGPVSVCSCLAAHVGLYGPPRCVQRPSPRGLSSNARHRLMWQRPVGHRHAGQGRV